MKVKDTVRGRSLHPTFPWECREVISPSVVLTKSIKVLFFISLSPLPDLCVEQSVAVQVSSSEITGTKSAVMSTSWFIYRAFHSDGTHFISYYKRALKSIFKFIVLLAFRLNVVPTEICTNVDATLVLRRDCLWQPFHRKSHEATLPDLVISISRPDHRICSGLFPVRLSKGKDAP